MHSCKIDAVTLPRRGRLVMKPNLETGKNIGWKLRRAEAQSWTLAGQPQTEVLHQGCLRIHPRSRGAAAGDGAVSLGEMTKTKKGQSH